MKRVIWTFLVLFVASCKTYDFPAVKNRNKLLVKSVALTYNAIIPDPDFKNLNMLGKVKKQGVYGQRLYGMILRSLRFKNITDKVERKYGLPENLLLAMIMHESGGVDLLPNSSDDGGIGLIHMQANMAKMFGLTTFKNCNKLVCKEHGEELRKIIKEYNSDRKKLIVIDDRFHPVLNIDAAARMLVYYRSGEQTQETPLKTAIYGYAGKYNYKKYYDNIEIYMSKLNDNEFLKEIEEDFDRQNQNLTLNGKPANFKMYIAAHQEQNINYGLNDYK